ncbi:hypothetical protein DWZ14_07805 [Enterocloster citroniae]|nr:hypothetical protein DWZ14_07805 [Enterocloster citroniae]
MAVVREWDQHFRDIKGGAAQILNLGRRFLLPGGWSDQQLISSYFAFMPGLSSGLRGTGAAPLDIGRQLCYILIRT